MIVQCQRERTRLCAVFVDTKIVRSLPAIVFEWNVTTPTVMHTGVTGNKIFLRKFGPPYGKPNRTKVC